MPTPRESTPAEPAPRPNTHKLLHAVGKKLAAAAASTSAPPPVTKRKRQESPPAVAPSKYKRRKTLPSNPTSAAHPRELIRKGWSRSGRKHLPSAKARETEPIQAQKRPRGRPRLHPLPTTPTPPTSFASTSTTPSSPPAAASAPASPFGASIAPMSLSPRTAKSRAVDDQPRENNGRFGKKASTNGKFRRRLGPTPALHRTRAQRAEGRAAAAAGASHGLAMKRERSYEHDHEYEDEDASELEESPKRSRIAGGSGHVPAQYFTPNPMSFARKKWAPQQPPPPPTHHLRSLGALPHLDQDVQGPSFSASAPPLSSQLSSPHLPPFLAESEVPEDETDGNESDDSDGPVTPENLPGPELEAHQDGDAGLESEDNELPMPGSSTRHSLPTMQKPSPFMFAARRWQDQFFRAPSTTEQTSSTPRRGPAASWGTGTATNVSSGTGDASRGPGASARNGSAGGSITRTEWVDVNGTAAEIRMWDTYEVDSVSSSEEEVC